MSNDIKLIIPQPKVRKIGVRPVCVHNNENKNAYTRKCKHKKDLANMEN